MRAVRASSIGAAVLTAAIAASASAVAQDEGPGGAGVERDVLWELMIPAEALPTDFVKLVVEDWTVAPGADTTGSTTSVLGNEAFRGRGVAIESGELIVVPAADAMLWRDTAAPPVVAPAGEAVTLAVGEAIFLPAIPDAAVDGDAPLVVANPGAEPVSARSFHAHQLGGSFLGYLPDVTLGPWDMAADFGPAVKGVLQDTGITLTLSRISAEPGASIPAAKPMGMYYVEGGTLEQVTSGAGGDVAYDWPTGTNGHAMASEGIERSMRVVGDEPATVLELSAVPQSQAVAQTDEPAAVTADEAAEVPGGATAFRGTATQYFMGLERETIVDGVTQYRGVRIGMVFESDDPRFSGEGIYLGNRDVHELAGVGLDVDRGTTRIANEGGAWDGESSAVLVDGLGGGADWYVGSGDYEGLTAFVRYVTAIPDTDGSYEFEGWIFPGEPPPLAEPGDE